MMVWAIEELINYAVAGAITYLLQETARELLRVWGV